MAVLFMSLHLSEAMAYLQYELGAEVDSTGRAVIDTSWSTQLQSSEHLWMLLEGAHVLTLMLFAGTILFVDLRLLGLVFRKVPVSAVADTVLPYTVAGFVIMAATGAALFFANPLEYYHNPVFRLKALFLVAASINIFFFHWRVQSDRTKWDANDRPPTAARTAAGISLVLWIAVIVAGRYAAYDWFKCGQATGVVAELAQCTEFETTLLHAEQDLAV